MPRPSSRATSSAKPSARIQKHRNAWGCRDAHWAAMGADAGVALAWLRRHVSKRAWRDAVTEPQAQGHTVFHKAAQRGRREAISRLLMEFEDDADALMMPLSPRTTRGGLPQKSRRPRGTRRHGGAPGAGRGGSCGRAA